MRPPPEPPSVAAKPAEPKKPTALGARLDALGAPPEAPPPPAPAANPWYAPPCDYPGVPINIDGQDGPDPLLIACYEQRAACQKRLDEAALRRVPKRVEIDIDARGEAHGVTIYQAGKKLDDDDLEEAVLCLFAMTPGEVAWELERCPA